MPPALPDQASPQDSVTFSKFKGMKNTVALERLLPDELSEAVNVDLDDAGQLRRRRGYRRVATGRWHSVITSLSGLVYGVRNGTLGRVYPNYQFHPIVPSIGAGPDVGTELSYLQLGDDLYFSARTDSGIIDTNSDTSRPWGALDPNGFWLSPVVHPTDTLPPIRGRLYASPPYAEWIIYYNGRIYMALGRMLWATELYLYNYIDKTKNFKQFESDITMLGAVSDGIYVGTRENVWFLSGPFAEMKRMRVLDSGVIPGSLVYIPQELANPPQIDLGVSTPVQVALLFLTPNGYCGAQEGGQIYNFTETTFRFPWMERATGIHRDQDGTHQYLVTGDSGGTPSSNTRIGDYLDAELIRAGTWRELSSTVRIGEHLSAELVPGHRA